jgi:hypothetical protein
MTNFELKVFLASFVFVLAAWQAVAEVLFILTDEADKGYTRFQTCLLYLIIGLLLLHAA